MKNEYLETMGITLEDAQLLRIESVCEVENTQEAMKPAAIASACVMACVLLSPFIGTTLSLLLFDAYAIFLVIATVKAKCFLRVLSKAGSCAGTAIHIVPFFPMDLGVGAIVFMCVIATYLCCPVACMYIMNRNSKKDLETLEEYISAKVA